MPRLHGFLDRVMNPPSSPSPPPNPTNDEDPPEVEHNGNPLNLGNEGPISEEVRLALEFAEACMDHHGLEGASRDNIRRFAKLDKHYREVELYVLIETLKHRSGGSTAAYDFVRSQTFLTHVVNRLKMVLLAPHSMFYVKHLQEWVLNDMHDHSVAWKIPQEIIDNNDQWEIFAAAVRVRLTTLRSQFKDRMFKAYASDLDINQIVYKLAPRQAIISDAHRARWAWIVLSIDDFKDACDEDEYEKGEFWDFVETQLSEAKKAIMSSPQFTTHASRIAKFAEVFTRALAEHHRLYPTRTQRGRTGERPGWQETIEEAMGMGREIYAGVVDDA